MFAPYEEAYLRSQRLARIATVGPDGQPDVTPVGYEFEDGVFYIGGFDIARTRKVRNIQAGNTRVALVIDDLPSVNPWIARGIRVYGTAELVERTGHLGAGTYLRIRPQVLWSWGSGNRHASQSRPKKHSRAQQRKRIPTTLVTCKKGVAKAFIMDHNRPLLAWLVCGQELYIVI